MRKYLFLLGAIILSLVACDKPAPEGEKPEIILAKSSLGVSAEGGDYTLRYSIVNPEESATIEFDYDAEWLESISAEDGNIRLGIARNEGEERRTEVVVNYDRAESVAFTIVQESAAGEAFEITVEELTGTSCTTRVTPADKEMYYVMYKSDIDFFGANNITNADELFADDMFYFKRGAEFDGLTLKEYMLRNKVLFSDVTRAAWPDLRPARKQILYVYGIEFSNDNRDCQRVTDITWTLIDPPTADLNDAKFDVSYTVDGADVCFDIKPIGWEGHYTVQFFDYNEELYYDASEGVSDDYVRSVGEGWITMFSNNLDGGLSAEEILSATCYKGSTQPQYELASYTLYTALVYAVEEVDGFYQMVSRPMVINFSTEQVEASDMTIDITVDNLYVRVCDLKVTPSANDESYAMVLIPTEYLPKNYTDQDLLDAALDTYYSFTYFFRGEVSSHLNSLYPSTEYIVITFGYSGGVITTPVFKKVFSTDEEGECELKIENVSYGGPYCLSELKALDPERFYNVPADVDQYMFGVWMEIETDKPSDDIFFYFVDTDTYAAYGEDIIFFDLLILTSPKTTFEIGYYDYNYYICAAAFDYRGNVTPMWRSDALSFDAENMRPAEELIAKLDGSTRARLAIADSRTGKICPVR